MKKLPLIFALLVLVTLHTPVFSQNETPSKSIVRTTTWSFTSPSSQTFGPVDVSATFEYNFWRETIGDKTYLGVTMKTSDMKYVMGYGAYRFRYQGKTYRHGELHEADAQGMSGFTSVRITGIKFDINVSGNGSINRFLYNSNFTTNTRIAEINKTSDLDGFVLDFNSSSATSVYSDNHQELTARINAVEKANQEQESTANENKTNQTSGSSTNSGSSSQNPVSNNTNTQSSTTTGKTTSTTTNNTSSNKTTTTTAEKTSYEKALEEQAAKRERDHQEYLDKVNGTGSNTSKANQIVNALAPAFNEWASQLVQQRQQQEDNETRSEIDRLVEKDRRTLEADNLKKKKQELVEARKNVIANFPDGKTPLSHEAKDATEVYFFIYSCQESDLENDEPVIYISNVFPVAKYADGTWPFKSNLMENIGKTNKGLVLKLSGYYLSQGAAEQQKQTLVSQTSSYGLLVKNIFYAGKKSTATTDTQTDFWGNSTKTEEQQQNTETGTKAKVDYWGNPVKD